MKDAHRQLAAIPARRLPARRAIGVAALGQDQRVGADLLGRIDQAKRHRLLQIDVAVDVADVGGLEALGMVGPTRADPVEDLRDVGERLGVVGELGGRDGDEIVGLVEVDVHRRRHAPRPPP